jgi:hypothetical protein
MPRINTRNADEYISELKPFTSNGAISADWDEAGAYVVKSYSTAIAVIYPDDNRAILNTARYSATTSRHQQEARIGAAKQGAAIFEISDPAAFETETGHRARLRGAGGWN